MAKEIRHGDEAWGDAGLLTEHLPLGVLRADSSGRCLALNTRAAELLGTSREEALGEGWWDCLHEDDRRDLLRRWEETAEEPTLFVMGLRVPGPDSSSRFLSCEVAPLPVPASGEAYFLTTLLDVSRHQRTEDDLRKTTRALGFRVRELDCLFEISRAVERSAGDLDAILREAAEILARTWDHPRPAWARITLKEGVYETPGFSPDGVDRRTDIFIHDEKVGKIEVGTEEPEPGEEGDLSAPEEERLLEAVAQRLGRTAERVMARRGLREKEEEMRERLTHLTRVSTMGEMASSIAHEVNQPLTAIATYARGCRFLIEKGEPDLEELSEVLERIGKEALRAGTIVNRLKDLVRRQESRWTECDLDETVKDVIHLASVDARLHDVDLRFDLAGGLPPILADPVQIQQVVLNLIRNGIDALENVASFRRRVVVRTGMAGPAQVRLSVEDNGCGLPEGSHDRLFEPFFTTKERGTGMGLSISRSIAGAHRGRISFTRNPSGGTTFHLTLPILDES
jgi:PAS domain S-box-containing protein